MTWKMESHNTFTFQMYQEDLGRVMICDRSLQVVSRGLLAGCKILVPAAKLSVTVQKPIGFFDKNSGFSYKSGDKNSA